MWISGNARLDASGQRSDMLKFKSEQTHGQLIETTCPQDDKTGVVDTVVERLIAIVGL